MDDEGLLFAIEQTIDPLTFAQTHIVDNDFRAHSKATVGSVMSLQEEQRSRVDQLFRAVPVSPQYLAALLLDVYRGEAASVNLARDNEPLFTEGGSVHDMSDQQCKSFKKEMKQRIHEWEGAFRDVNGREPAPQDKVVLRPIYELYKHAKNRVVKAESNQAAPVVQAAIQAQQRASQGYASGHQLGSSSTPSRPNSAPQVHPTPDRGHASVYNAVTPASTSANRPSSATTPAPPVIVATPIAGPSPQLLGSTHQTPIVAPGQELPLEELIREKRNIKRQLHQFEATFEQRYGRKPTRDDRREYSQEYHRYGELKALLNEHAVLNEQ